MLTPEMIPCAYAPCGKLFPKTNWKRRFCSKACAAKQRILDSEVRARAQEAGRKFWAKPETKAKRRERLDADPEYREYMRAAVRKHAAKTKAKRTTPEGKAATNAKRRAYLASPGGKAKRAAWLKEYYAKPEVKARIIEQERINRETKREDYRRRAREYGAKLRQSAQHRVHYAMSVAVRRGLRERKNGQPWEGLVGYTCEDLMRHLERQFIKGMTWENYGLGLGRWHVDHIIAATSFTFESRDDPDFKACWALSNLRPMWGSENISKGNKRLFLL